MEPASPHGGNGVASTESRRRDVPKSRFPVAAIVPSAGINFMTAVSFFGPNRSIARLAKP
jgi:hypothetical protein